MHSVNVISPFIIETKELFYADIHTRHTFKVLEDSHDDSHNQTLVMREQNFTNKNLRDIKLGQLILVQYKERFLGINLAVSTEGAKMQCLEHPYGVSGPQDVEKETRGVWYPSERHFEAPVVPNAVQIKRAWKYTYYRYFKHSDFFSYHFCIQIFKFL